MLSDGQIVFLESPTFDLGRGRGGGLKMYLECWGC